MQQRHETRRAVAFDQTVQLTEWREAQSSINAACHAHSWSLYFLYNLWQFCWSQFRKQSDSATLYQTMCSVCSVSTTSAHKQANSARNFGQGISAGIFDQIFCFYTSNHYYMSGKKQIPTSLPSNNRLFFRKQALWRSVKTRQPRVMKRKKQMRWGGESIAVWV